MIEIQVEEFQAEEAIPHGRILHVQTLQKQAAVAVKATAALKMDAV